MRVPIKAVGVILGAIVVNIIVGTIYFNTQNNRIEVLQKWREDREQESRTYKIGVTASFADVKEKQNQALRELQINIDRSLEALRTDYRERGNLTQADVVLLRAQVQHVSDELIKAQSRIELLWSQFPGPADPRSSQGGRK